VALDGSYDQFLLNKRRKLSPVYASAELLWYLSRSKSTSMIEAYAPNYKLFADDGYAYGAYGGRLAENADEDLLNGAIARLLDRQSTKRCAVSLWRPNDLFDAAKYKDVPCTLSWQFLMHDDKLDMLVSMRSNDLWKGFLYDVYVNTCIHRYVAARVGVPVGTYHHFAGSMHLYAKDVKRAKEAIEAPWPNIASQPSVEHCLLSPLDIQCAIEGEKGIRTMEHGSLRYVLLPGMLLDALKCCESHFGRGWHQVMSPVLQKGMELFHG
jgi:thymidylate synthase